jgi:hypothetical protein
MKDRKSMKMPDEIKGAMGKVDFVQLTQQAAANPFLLHLLHALHGLIGSC